MRETVLFGGTFDPPHVGHVLGVAWLLSALDADVWVEPVHRHVLGKAPLPFPRRTEWCDLAFGIFGPRVTVRADEQRPGASGTTIDLVRHLQQHHPDRRFRLAVGSDILAERHRWVDFPGLIALAPLIVLPRPGFAVPDDVVGLIAPLELPDVSSTELRADWAAGKSLAGRVPAAVIAAMGTHAG
jgi:nicotinate-nucleotide adenylyltransferase